jgi:ABC-type antimicrobial peptide transport system permease subunit
MNMVVRGEDPMGAMTSVARAVQDLGAARPIRDMRRLDDYVADASADTRFALFVLGVLATLALSLTAVGIYGVSAYATARRAREIAVRLALGADATGIVALVLRDGVGWTALGLAIGVAGSLALSRYLGRLLFAVGERDPLTFTSVAIGLGIVALAATAIPAVRAVRSDPIHALRAE